MTRYSISSQFYGAHLYNWHGNYLWFWSMQIGQFTNTNSVLLQHHQGAIIILCFCQICFCDSKCQPDMSH